MYEYFIRLYTQGMKFLLRLKTGSYLPVFCGKQINAASITPETQ
jgi:hypothetical protein